MVKLLIDRGADVNLHGGSGGITALIYSFVEGKNLDVPKFLLQKGANPNSVQTDGRTALLSAPLHGADAVKLLLDYGANPNLKYYNGTTALINASWVGDIESTKLLVVAGADVNAKNDSGHTALNIATEKGYTEIADYLKQHGATN
jgi:ankyrin repeat protein